MRFPTEIVRLRAALVPSDYNPDDLVADWANPDRKPLAGFVDAQSSAELADPVRSESVTTTTVYLDDVHADIRRGDRVEYAGGTWTIEGFPAAPMNPFTGWQPYLIVSLQLVVG